MYVVVSDVRLRPKFAGNGTFRNITKAVMNRIMCKVNVKVPPSTFREYEFSLGRNKAYCVFRIVPSAEEIIRVEVMGKGFAKALLITNGSSISSCD